MPTALPIFVYAVGGLVSEITTVATYTKDHTIDFSTLKPDDKLDRWQAAKYLGNTYNTLTAWVPQKKGPPFYKNGKRVHYLKRDLDAFLETRRVEFEQVPL